MKFELYASTKPVSRRALKDPVPRVPIRDDEEPSFLRNPTTAAQTCLTGAQKGNDAKRRASAGRRRSSATGRNRGELLQSGDHRHSDGYGLSSHGDEEEGN